MVAKYLRENGFPQADRMLREGRNDDQGDIAGVPHTTIQVKYWAAKRLPAWVNDTLRQRDTAGTPLCMIVARQKYRAVEGWDAYMPSGYFMAGFEELDGTPVPGQPDELEAWTWLRMDLRLAVVALKRMTEALGSLSTPSSVTMESTFGEVVAWHSAPFTENESPPSPTT